MSLLNEQCCFAVELTISCCLFPGYHVASSKVTKKATSSYQTLILFFEKKSLFRSWGRTEGGSQTTEKSNSKQIACLHKEGGSTYKTYREKILSPAQEQTNKFTPRRQGIEENISYSEWQNSEVSGLTSRFQCSSGPFVSLFVVSSLLCFLTQRVAFHPNCNYVATGSCDRTVRLWDLNTGSSVRFFTGHKVSKGQKFKNTKER